LAQGYRFHHPYQPELDIISLNYSDLTKILTKQIDDVSLSISTNFHFVEKLEDLQFLIEHLKDKNIFSFDAHNHSFRSYQGYLCFLEISTEKADFVIDCFKLREHLHLLNHSFSNPKIFKIGLDSKDKVLWLQRDFGVYVVNLLDVKFILSNLNLPISLPFLSNKFLDFSFKSVFTEFDFRKRPINQNEKQYLRSFSHLNLRLFFKLRTMIPKFGMDSFYNEVFEESKRLCMGQYEKPFTDEGYFDMVNTLKIH
jgi:exosome complex exonuclease RRP6